MSPAILSLSYIDESKAWESEYSPLWNIENKMQQIQNNTNEPFQSKKKKPPWQTELPKEQAPLSAIA